NKEKCCNSKCKFTKGQYFCADGDCCKNCEVLSESESKYSIDICRHSTGECDIVEACSGFTNKGFCYDGNCMNSDYMCKYAYNDCTNSNIIKLA
ncbi:hypothetical protein MXB_5241, partial [Myxobolus squamalis]